MSKRYLSFHDPAPPRCPLPHAHDASALHVPHAHDTLPERARSTAAQARPDASGDSRFQLWMWGGKLRPVPEGWQLPSTDAMATWRLWYFGNVSERIRPLRHLHKSDLDSKHVSRWSKAQ